MKSGTSGADAEAEDRRGESTGCGGLHFWLVGLVGLDFGGGCGELGSWE